MALVKVSTPSRLCLFGEHQDYLGLEVIASAINMRFHAYADGRDDCNIVIHYGGGGQYPLRERIINPNESLVYENKRDYMKSTLNVLMKKGFKFDQGFDIYLDSEIPVSKGMCSSTALVIVLLKLYLELLGAPEKDDAEKIALWGFEAEVEEFGEPGGKMDHFTSALGGLVHLDFRDNSIASERIEAELPGKFLLFDSLEPKDTIKVLASAKTPVLEGLSQLAKYGVRSIRDLAEDEGKLSKVSLLSPAVRQRVLANVDNFRIQREALGMLKSGDYDDVRLGELLKRHHANLRDGLEISTPTLEKIFDKAYSAGALGGKLNGSGGGGCGYVYVRNEDADRIKHAIEALGYPVYEMKQDAGLRKEE